MESDGAGQDSLCYTSRGALAGTRIVKEIEDWQTTVVT